MARHLTPWLTRPDRALWIRDRVRLTDAAATLPTPCYLTDLANIRDNAQRLQAGIKKILPRRVRPLFAIKANNNRHVVQTLVGAGLGLDIVSWQEGHHGLNSGCPANAIAFSGVGKTRQELAWALDNQIGLINIESVDELHCLHECARARNATPAVLLRVKPGIAASTGDNIATGRLTDKFGIDATAALTLARHVAAMPAIAFHGFSMHLGSQLFNLDEIIRAGRVLVALTGQLLSEGIPVKILNFGGGLGVRYRPDDPEPIAFDSYAESLGKLVSALPPELELIIEPGRCLVAEAAVLLTRVIRQKNDSGRRFVIVDAAMNDLMRPALYGATHNIVPACQNGTPVTVADIVGPVCETTDRFALDWPLQEVAAGDILLLETAGAYGAVLANRYNLRPLPNEAVLPPSSLKPKLEDNTPAV